MSPWRPPSVAIGYCAARGPLSAELVIPLDQLGGPHYLPSFPKGAARLQRVLRERYAVPQHRTAAALSPDRRPDSGLDQERRISRRFAPAARARPGASARRVAAL